MNRSSPSSDGGSTPSWWCAPSIEACAAVRRSGPVGSLTEREREVLALRAERLRNREIANRLVISEATVKTHVRHVLEKLRFRNPAEAAAFAAHHQLGRPGEATHARHPKAARLRCHRPDGSSHISRKVERGRLQTVLIKA